MSMPQAVMECRVTRGDVPHISYYILYINNKQEQLYYNNIINGTIQQSKYDTAQYKTKYFVIIEPTATCFDVTRSCSEC